MPNTAENYPIINIPYLYKYGLIIQNSTSIDGTLHPETKLSVLAGNCRDDADITDIRFGDNNPSINGAITSAPVRIDNTINGVGGLDQGQIAANTMYAIYIIADSRGYLPISAIATLALNIFLVPAGPLMPSGYDSKRLIGFWGTDGGTLWQKGYYYGLNNDLVFTYDTPQLTSVTSGTSNMYAYVNLFDFVPNIENIPVSISTVFSPGAAGDTLTLASGRSTSTQGQVIITGQVSGVNITTVSSIITQHVLVAPIPFVSPVIQYKVSGSDTVAISVAGFSVSV
jgi:hypothetical protein